MKTSISILSLGLNFLLLTSSCSFTFKGSPTIRFLYDGDIQSKSKCFSISGPLRGHLDLKAIEDLEKQFENDDAPGHFEDYLLDSSSTDTFEIKTFEVTAELDGTRVDFALAVLAPQISRSFCGNLISTGKVKILSLNGNEEIITRKSFKVNNRLII